MSRGGLHTPPALSTKIASNVNDYETKSLNSLLSTAEPRSSYCKNILWAAGSVASDMFGMDVVQTEESVAENFQIIGVRVFWLVLRSVRIFGRWSNISFNSDFTSRQWLGILFYFNYFFFTIHLTFNFHLTLPFFFGREKFSAKWGRKSGHGSQKVLGIHTSDRELKNHDEKVVWVLHMFRSV